MYPFSNSLICQDFWPIHRGGCGLLAAPLSDRFLENCLAIQGDESCGKFAAQGGVLPPQLLPQEGTDYFR
jgi:hypothetical protein